MCEEVQFTPPWWDETASRKHRRTGARSEQMWDSSILTSQTKDAPAAYDPRIQQDEIRLMEMECVAQGIAGAPGVLELPRKVAHVRKFCRALDRIIGAGNGEKTNRILVVYGQTGSVHGYPVTCNYLKSKGVKVQ